MFYRKARKAADALSSLMSQTRDTMVCFDFCVPIDPNEAQSVIDAKLRDCIVVEASRSFALYFGFNSREAVIGKKMLDLFDGKIPDWFVSYGQEVEDRQFKNLERLVEVPVGGEMREMRIYMENIFANGMLIRQWVTIRNATAQEQQRRALLESERMKALALNAAGLETFTLNLGAQELVNHSHGAMSARGKDQGNWWNNIHPEDRAAVESQFKSFYLGENEQLHAIFRTVSGDNVCRWVETWAVASARNGAGQPQKVVGVMMDRTENKALEEKLQSKQKLESLGVLAGGIAHDFNNLLLSITSSIDVTTFQYPHMVSELSPIDNAASQAALLCEQLLTYAGQGPAVLEVMDLSETITLSEPLLTISVGVGVTVEFTLDKKCWVNGDDRQLIQVLMNLVKNASDAMSETPGTIRIGLKSLTFEPHWTTEFHMGAEMQVGEYICLSIEDSGVGMTAADLEHLFDPFFTTKFTGRGLGMAVVMGIVRAHGGAIAVDSRLNEGTKVRVLLPRVHGRSKPARAPVAQVHQLRGRVLLVDDELAVRQAAARLLEVIGLEVELAESGLQAIAMIDATPDRYDVIMMDVTMPDLDGVESASRILAKHPQAKIVVCSGYSEVAMPEVLSNAVVFLQKPYRLAKLLEILPSQLTC